MNTSYTKLVGGIIVVVILVGAAVYWFPHKKSSPTDTKNSTQTSTNGGKGGTTNPPGATPGAAGGYKTFVNSELAYSIKYPPTWILSKYDLHGVIIANYASSNGYTSIPGADNVRIVISDYSYVGVNVTGDELASRVGMTNKVHTTIGGVSAAKGAIKSGNSTIGAVFFLYKGRAYEITYAPYSTALSSTVSTILSTFKFTQ